MVAAPGPEPAQLPALGCGKTLPGLCALGCQSLSAAGTALVHHRPPRLLPPEAGARAKVDGSYAGLFQVNWHIELLILDDWGLEAVNAAEQSATHCWEIMDDRRYGKYSRY